MLVSEGREHDILKDVLVGKDKTTQKIANSAEVKRALYKNCPRLVPPEFNPKCIETYIRFTQKSPDEIDEEAGPSRAGGAKKKGKSKNGEADTDINQPSTSKGSKGKKKPPTSGNIQKFFDNQRKNAQEQLQMEGINEDEDLVDLNDSPIFNVSNKTVSIGSEKPLQASEVLMDCEFPDYLKKFVIENDPNFVKQTLQATSDGSADKQKVAALKSHFNAVELKSILKKLEEPKVEGIWEKFERKFNDNKENVDFVQRVTSKFQRLMEKKLPLVPVPVIEPLQATVEISQPKPVNVFETQQDLFIENESRYQQDQNSWRRNNICNSTIRTSLSPQVNSSPRTLPNSPVILKSSTPVRKQSLPKNIKSNSKSNLHNSPLLRAFERSIKKKTESESSTPKKPEQKVSNIETTAVTASNQNETLKFFGIESVEDIFGTSSSEDEAIYDNGRTTSRMYGGNGKASGGFKFNLCEIPKSVKEQLTTTPAIKLNVCDINKSLESGEKRKNFGKVNEPRPEASLDVSNVFEQKSDLSTELILDKPVEAESLENTEEVIESSVIENSNILKFRGKLQSNERNEEISEIEATENILVSSSQEILDSRKGFQLRFKLIQNLKNGENVDDLRNQLTTTSKIESNLIQSANREQSVTKPKSTVQNVVELKSSSSNTTALGSKLSYKNSARSQNSTSNNSNTEIMDEESDSFLANLPLDEILPKSSPTTSKGVNANHSAYTITQILQKVEAKDGITEIEEMVECSQEDAANPLNWRGRRKLQAPKKPLTQNLDWSLENIFSDSNESSDSTKTVDYDYPNAENDSKNSTKSLDKGAIISSNDENYDFSNKNTPMQSQFKSPSIYEKKINHSTRLQSSFNNNSVENDFNIIASPQPGPSSGRKSFFEKILSYEHSQRKSNDNEKRNLTVITCNSSGSLGENEFSEDINDYHDATQSPIVAKITKKVQPIILSSEDEEGTEEFLTAKLVREIIFY